MLIILIVLIILIILTFLLLLPLRLYLITLSLIINPSLFSGLGCSFSFLILFINVRINALLEQFWYRTPKPGL